MTRRILHAPGHVTGKDMKTTPRTHGLPRFGHLIDVGIRPLGFFTALQRTYPDLVTVDVYGGEFTYISHPDLVEEILVTQQKKIQKDGFLKQHAKPVFGNGLLASDGEFWLRQRRMAQPAFHRTRIAEYAAVMSRHADTTFAAISPGSWVDIHPVMMRLTLDIVAETLFGTVHTDAKERIGRALETIMAHFAGDSLLQVLGMILQRSLDPAEEAAYQNAVQTFDTVIDAMIMERKRNPQDDTDLLGMFLAARDIDETPMSDTQLRDECKTMFLAGHETTALTLSWTLWLLATHPEIQQTLATEVASVIGQRAPTIEDMGALPVLEQVIRESMRLYPPAWVIQRESLEALTVTVGANTYTIPAEHNISLSPAAMHRDPRFFADPDTFIPSRWTQDFMAQLPKYAYFPFGGGPRLCIGQQFAMMELTLILARAIQAGTWQAKRLQRVVAQPSITQRPKYGISLRVRPHAKSS